MPIAAISHMNKPSRTAITVMAVLLSFAICVFFAVSSVFADVQQPLGSEPFLVNGELDLIYELKKAEIIPTVIDSFNPLLTVSVSWSDAEAEYGNTINPSKTQKQPKLKFIDAVPSLYTTKEKTPQLTIAMSDPDAPSRVNPEWSEICHWIATDVSLTKPDDNTEDEDSSQHMKRLLDVMPYKPPGPPPKTGKHRYVFVALAPKNGTTASLNLSKPGDRQHWGYEHERDGLRLWAEEMGLGVVGANFIYAQNDEQ